MKIGENDSAHEIFYFFILMIYTYKLLKAFLPKASVENSSAQWAIFLI